jgi:hypothetical protein
MRRKYDADMELVRQARTLLQGGNRFLAMQWLVMGDKPTFAQPGECSEIENACEQDEGA